MQVWLGLVVSVTLMGGAYPFLLASVVGFAVDWTLAKSFLLIAVCIGAGALFVLNFALALVTVSAIHMLLLPISTLLLSYT
jgi:hypothetical protein